MADPENNSDERIVMTPTKKTPRSTTIKIERIKQKELNSGILHVAGGDHKGIVISKGSNYEDALSNEIPPQLHLEFKVFLVNKQTNNHTQESRRLRFWFKVGVTDEEQTSTAQDFFKELVSPMEFPRDYVGFIKKIMKLMQNRYPHMKKIEVDLEQLEEAAEHPTRPMSLDESISSGRAELTQERVLEIIESAYPNPLSVKDLAKQSSDMEEEIQVHIAELECKGLVRAVEGHSGRNYIRATSNIEEIKIVRQMPTVASSQQPTIAIITAQYCEKLAVDAMIENKDTYVRYTTVGETNVYTLGNIGAHRVVSTKLPSVGHTRAAMIAAGNTTTRLLGSFQKVEYVFLVGCGGGVPHYTDYARHVRLGDVVVSHPPDNRNYIYAYCDQVKRLENGGFMFEAKTWTPPDMRLQEIARQLWQVAENNPEQCPWLEYLHRGQRELGGQELGQPGDFERPPSDTDRLYMSLGGTDMIEVAHPTPPPLGGVGGGVDLKSLSSSVAEEMGRVHFGAIGSGRHVVRDDAVRQEFAKLYGVLAFDTEFDAVVESIFGNRKDSYVFIRGISDYRDGMRKKEWQPYSALSAAAFMKAVICALALPDDD